jgi:ABC-type transport system involved in cytochrome c biogenesis permease subunit
MNDISRYVPWAVLGVAVLYLVLVMVPPQDPPDKMHLHEFSQLPVMDHGRVKPLDTVARNTLMGMSDRQSFRDEKDEPQPAIKWLLDVMTSVIGRARSDPKNADGLFDPNSNVAQYKVFRIDNDQMLSFLHLEARPGLRYSLTELAPRLGTLEEEAEQADAKEPSERSPFEGSVVKLRDEVGFYLKLSFLEAPFLVPPQDSGGEWKSLPRAFRQRDSNPAVESLLTILNAYSTGNVKEFNREVAAYRQRLDKQLPADTSMASFEVFFNNFAPFYQCAGLYVFMFLLAACAWIGWTQPLNRAAFWLGVLTLVVHTWALGARMYLMQRPFVFVTNLYSSAVFIGWGAVFLGLVLERIYRNGFGLVVASVTGSLSLLIAHLITTTNPGGDTLDVLQAVLDTTFWLATHVTCVTIGYTATFVAGFLGIGFILAGVLTPSLDKHLWKALSTAIYGVVCFATLFSFTGTVLGGIWADQSWGRFWGWDPKENGALLIVIWNALILHARWGGMVKQRGMAVLAVLGNIVVGWSWFGTNMLGVGLHSYGFMSGAATLLVIFDAFFLLVAGLGTLPEKYWLSLAVQKDEAAAPAPPPPSPPAPAGRRRRPGRDRGPGIVTAPG